MGSTVTGRIKLSAPPGVEVPASALTEANGRPAVWVVDPQSQTVSLRSVDVSRYDPATVVISQGLETGDVVVTAGVQVLRPGQKVRLAGSRVMNRFNLSEWAIRHRSLVTYFMLVIVVAGIGSYLRLGRSEDPDFTVKTMVVQAAWPGATVGDTLEQITDRIESKLQETPSLDYLKSYTSAGKATIFVYLKDLDAPGAGAGHLVPGAQEGGRHPQHAAAGHRRPRLQRRVRRHLRHRLRLHRGRIHPPGAEGLRR